MGCEKKVAKRVTANRSCPTDEKDKPWVKARARPQSAFDRHSIENNWQKHKLGRSKTLCLQFAQMSLKENSPHNHRVKKILQINQTTEINFPSVTTNSKRQSWFCRYIVISY